MSPAAPPRSAPLNSGVNVNHRLDVVMGETTPALSPGVICANPPRCCGVFMLAEVIGKFSRDDRVSIRYCGNWATMG